MTKLSKIETKPKSGTEPFLGMDKTLLDYWSWAHSDIAANAERGKIAEYIIHCALHSNSTHRIEWDAVDVITPDGIKVEVKSSAYLQSWHQEKYSNILFDIAPKRAWDSATNLYSESVLRSADVYVFCLFSCKDANLANPMDLTQWEFYIVPTRVLNQKMPAQKSIGLKAVAELSGGATKFEDLEERIRRTQLH